MGEPTTSVIGEPDSAATVYSHTQVAAPMVAVLLAGLAVQIGRWAASVRDGHRRRLQVLPAVGATAFAAYLLSSLTVTVRRDAVELWFTGHLFRRRVPLADVVEARVVRAPWWHGWGLRFTPSGVLYRIWGLEGVELKLHGGSTVTIGSDEPHLLVGALRTAIAARHGRSQTD